MTKECMSYAAYSLTGKNISFDFLDANEYGDWTGIGFGIPGGNEGYSGIDDLTVEYAGNGIYRVFLDVGYGIHCEFYREVAKVTFLITKTPNSCYGGFSVIGVETIRIVNNAEWKDLYQLSFQ